MKTYLTLLISVLGAAVAFSQPTIPVNNVSPVAANSLVGKIGTAGRGQSIPIGSGLAFVNGVLVATGGGGGGSGTVTSIPDGSTNGVTWTVATRTTTPTFTFALGAITPTSILASGAISAGTTITAGTTFIATGAASPSTPTAGQFGFDTNAWASGRGAIQLNDGTANTYVVGVQASDVPLNGQFPRWNTGGTITWETPAGAGNVNAAGALTSGDIVIGQGGTDVATSPVIQIAPGEVTVNGNATITGSTSFANLTTTNLTVSGNVSSAGTLDGQLWIGSTASGNFTKATLTEGSNISIVNGANSITISSTASGGGTLTLKQWSAADNQPPAADFATTSTRNSILILEHADAVDQSTIFVGKIPQGSDFTTGISVLVTCISTVDTGNYVLVSAFEKCNTDLDTDSFATGVSAATTTSGTVGIPTTTTINHSGAEIDGVAAGDMFRIRITRDGDAVGDTMAGTLQMLVLEIQQR